ncbi:glycosyltransferase family 1 protein [Brunnivagina elsteri]|uniref:Glycosyltransferase n=1 Tax=Brunnivagina elsteri CCALA 953 TaxID=987040 RepID=A0A2A2TNE9_9CYAN|nr:glycosyltransferase family 1 protein [Calothrix elsteri]PAX60009.1 glycosyltransferase [Calothrix elsteri CCALA 953]
MDYVKSINIPEQSQKLSKKRPIRILQVVGGMNRAGAETWLMNVLRNIDRESFQMDFLVHTTEPCAYDEEIHEVGGRVIPCLHPSKPWLYAKNFQKILREYGPYDVVHSHIHHFSGYILRLAKQAGVPTRIVHSHLDSSSHESNLGWKRKLYVALMKSWIEQNSTLGLACSQDAANDLFGSNWKNDKRWQLLYYGIDLTPFHEEVDASKTRAELGIPEDAFVIGHVGRFEQQKNHDFLIKIAAEIAKSEPKMRLLLVGNGSLHSHIEHQVQTLGLSDRVIFTGSRSDVFRLMLGVMDVFLFPSLYEGLGLVLVEAQAAGLPCIISDVIPKEADIVMPLIHRLCLTEQINVWVDAVLKTRNQKTSTNQSNALFYIKQSSFDIKKCIIKLVNVYGCE